MLIGAPVALALFGLPRKHWAPRRPSVALPMLVACALLFGATLHVARNEDGRRRHAFELEAVNALNSLSDKQSMPLTALEANHSLLLVAPDISRGDFERAHAERARAGGAVYAVGWAPLVRPQEVPTFGTGGPRPTATSVIASTERRRPGDLTPTRPRTGCRSASSRRSRATGRRWGANIRNIPQARAAQERAMATGEPSASESFPLSQDAGVTLMGVVVYRALYEGGSTDPRDAAGRARKPTGVASRRCARRRCCTMRCRPAQAGSITASSTPRPEAAVRCWPATSVACTCPPRSRADPETSISPAGPGA